MSKRLSIKSVATIYTYYEGMHHPELKNLTFNMYLRINFHEMFFQNSRREFQSWGRLFGGRGWPREVHPKCARWEICRLSRHGNIGMSILCRYSSCMTAWAWRWKIIRPWLWIRGIHPGMRTSLTSRPAFSFFL